MYIDTVALEKESIATIRFQKILIDISATSYSIYARLITLA